MTAEERLINNGYEDIIYLDDIHRHTKETAQDVIAKSNF